MPLAIRTIGIVKPRNKLFYQIPYGGDVLVREVSGCRDKQVCDCFRRLCERRLDVIFGKVQFRGMVEISLEMEISHESLTSTSFVI